MKSMIHVFLFCASAVTLRAQGYYLEYKVSSAGAEGEVTGTMKTYAQDGNSRMEMSMQLSGMGEIQIVSLVLGNEPNTVYLLDEKNKTYRQLSRQQQEDWKDYPPSEYEITVLGKEQVNGYNSTHLSVKRKGSTQVMEMWTSTEVNGYADLSKIKTRYTGKDNLLKALHEKGAEGFPVRIKTEEHRYAMQLDLVKAERRSNPEGLFTLNNYTKAAGSYPVGNGNSTQEMIQKIQNMTPEEREKWIRQMQEQYQPH